MTDSIDTNVVLRCILGDVPEQRTLAAKLLSTPNCQHYLSSQAISECVFVLETVGEMSREEIANQLDIFLARYSKCLIFDQKLTELTFLAYLAHPKLSWNDCVLAAEAELRHHEPLLTFDKRLANQLPQAKVLKSVLQ